MIEVRIPQLGEGLREVRIVKFDRGVGDAIAKGEVLYSVETDKSVVELESPVDGVISAWSVGEGDIVPIGATVAMVANDGAAEVNGARQAAPTVAIPPRTRAYAKEKGIADELLGRMRPADGRKLYPADIDAHLDAKGIEPKGFVDKPLSPTQKVLNYRFRRSAALVIPTSLSIEVDAAVFTARAPEDVAWVSNVQRLAFAVALTAKAHPVMRSVLIGEDTLREYEHVNVGIAVARPNGDLVTSAVKEADSLPPQDFIRAYRQGMRAAVKRGDQADDDIHILLTTLDEFGIEEALPTLVAPANSAIFLGSRNRSDAHKLVMVFDHRIMNGVAAARFLSDLARQLGSKG